MTDTQVLIERCNSAAIEWVAKRWPHPWDYPEREAAEEAYVAALTDAEAKLAKAREGLGKIASLDLMVPFGAVRSMDIARACLAELGEG